MPVFDLGEIINAALVYCAPVSAQIVFSLFLLVSTRMDKKDYRKFVGKFEQRHERELTSRTEFFQEQLKHYKKEWKDAKKQLAYYKVLVENESINRKHAPRKTTKDMANDPPDDASNDIIIQKS